LTASSRNIIRWWLAKARRRQRLRQLVEPVIRKSRGIECEQCLSRKQLQVEYDIDIDQMIKMYETTFPDDMEIDQVQWKEFWTRHQHHHTICLACISKRKENQKKGYVPHAPGEGGTPYRDEADTRDKQYDQEAYPDWGPVFLTAASKPSC